ncbi:MAG: 5-(carboxyamino)imidazole ribonucleotide mutase [Clostridia bacterium]|nr:5-(carboxyamino)imidazole ribonucleotide mutase [Clostridia bacterium]
MIENVKPKVLVVMGSDSDFTVVKECLKTLKQFDIEFTAEVCSAHRTPEEASALSRNAESNGYELIIAAAGKAAHLPGVLAAFTALPVIGLPIKSSTLDGMDSLLSIVQMPPGIPVATVAIDGALNAALLAIQILSVKHEFLRAGMKQYKENMKKKVNQKNENLKDLIEKEI